MLVKKSIVEKWYQRDNWVYKNFAYLFVNPLWQKSVPQGFSVCPYFWLNLFSLFIFRPFFVMPINYVFRPLIKAIGKPAVAVDDFFRFIFGKLGMIPNRAPDGAGVVFAVLWTMIAASSSGFVYLIGTEFYPYVAADVGGKFAFWSILSFIGLWAVIGLHKKFTETECKTMNYLYVWFAVLIVAMFIFVPAEAIGMGKNFLGGIGWMFSELAKGIWFVITWIAKWVWFGLTWAPVDALVVPWPIYIAAIGLFGLISDRIMQYSENRNYDKVGDANVRDRNRDAWVTVFVRTLCLRRHWKSGEELSNNYGLYRDYNAQMSEYEETAMIQCRHSIYYRAMEILFQSKLSKLQKTYPLLKTGAFTEISAAGCLENRFEKLGELTNVDLTFTDEKWTEAIRKAVNEPKLRTTITELAEHYRSKAEDKAKRDEERKNSAMHLMCLRVTGGIGIIVGCIKKFLVAFFVGIWTFLVYLWMLIKAKKKGACPYFRFTDSAIKK